MTHFRMKRSGSSQENAELGKGTGASECAVRERETLRTRAKSTGKNRDVDCIRDVKGRLSFYGRYEKRRQGDLPPFFFARFLLDSAAILY